MKPLSLILFILVIVGALNWGLVGIFNFDLVATLFGEMTVVSRIVYSLVGIAAIILPIIKFSGNVNCSVSANQKHTMQHEI